MAKHPKQKQGGAQKKGGKRVEPYAKKAKVEVTFEGDQPVKTSSNGPNQSTSKPAKSAVQPKQVSEPASKGKGKEKASESTVAEVEEEQVSGSTFVVVAGSYEKLLYGLEGSYTPGSTKPTLKPIFIFPAHLACVKAVSGSPGGKWLATGSEDEFVKVWDLRRRKEVGSLSQHTGSITSLHFPTPSHLITTSEDSTMSLFRTSDWALLKSLKGHSGRVNHVDVHPTGRVALSVGKDKTLKMWDLMRGRGAASLALGTEAELVKFSPLGTHFAVLYPKKVEIYSLTLKLLKTITGTARFNALAFSLLPVEENEEDKEVLCVGTEKGKVEVYTVELFQDEAEEDEEEDEDEKDEGEKEESGAVLTKIGTLVGATNRIKSISVLAHTTPSSSSHPAQRLILLSSVSSDGHIRLYELTAVANNASETQEVEPVASYDTKGSRLTVCHITDGRKLSALTKTADVAEEGSDEDDDEDEADEDMYDNDDDEEEDDEGGMEVEIEGEEEDEEEEEEEAEEEDEGEYE